VVTAGHAHALYLHGISPVHRLPPECKVAAMLVFVIAVVATPPRAVWAFAIYAAIAIGALAIAGVPPGVVVRRAVIEIPFLVFAVMLPFLGPPPDVAVGFMELSVEGLWGAWSIVIKGTLGVLASITLTATTEVTDILEGLDRLRVPRVFTDIAGFMVRYLDVILGEQRRMRVAMLSRGYDPRWWWQARALAASAGSLFIRSYERGERVFFAMTARGYQGHMPRFAREEATPRSWALALSLPGLAILVAVAATTLIRVSG
jgi:cobalt/nickel transport system permease protein